MTRWRWRRAAAALVLLAAVVAAVALLLSPDHPHRSSPPPPRSSLPAHRRARPAPRPPQSSEQFGVNVNRLFNDRTFTPAQIDSQLQALSATGATLARSDALWEAVEPAPPTDGSHHYDWSFDDMVAGSLAAHRLRWLPILDYSAPWARTQPTLLHSPPRSPSEFAVFAAALAERYGPGGAFWREHPELAPQPIGTYEVWNEPDNGVFWQPAPDAPAYADLYLATREAVVRVDPSARVIVGGLISAFRFLPALLQSRPQLRGALEGVAIHPYGSDPAVVLAKVRQARVTLAALGLRSVPLYVTEFGWTTHPPGALNFAPESVRPRYIERALAALGHTDCGIAATVLYTWVTPERNPAQKEDWYGIHPPGGGSSPDSTAFEAGVRDAVAPAPRDHLCGAT
jgi:hypothetical protein